MANTVDPMAPNASRRFLCRIVGTVSAPLVLALALAGCGAGSGNYSRDAAGNITVHCNQSELRWNACYDAAARLCGDKGYQIVEGVSGGAPTTTTNIYEVPVIGDAIVIRCNS